MSSVKENDVRQEEGGETRRCERCDREVRHFIKLTSPDNSEQYVCWSCFSRGEKRVSVRDTWRRAGR